MPDLFGIDIAGILADAIGADDAPALTLIKITPGTRTTNTGGNHPTSVSYTARGFMTSYKESQIDGTIVVKGDRQITIIGGALPAGIVPAVGDQIVMEGKTWSIVPELGRDPAAATYTCHVRG